MSHGEFAARAVAFLACASALAPAARAVDHHRDYRLHSRYWLAYEADEKTLSLFHLDRKAVASDEDVIAEMDDGLDAPEDEGGVEALLKDEVGGGGGGRGGRNGRPEGESARDGGPGRRHGGLVGPIEWVPRGRFGGAVRLKGGAALVTEAFGEVGSGAPFTAECWAFPEEDADGVLISCDSSRGGAAFALARRADGSLELLCGERAVAVRPAHDDGVLSPSKGAVGKAGTLAPARSWTHVALEASPPRSIPGRYQYLPTQVGAQLMLYVNGVLECTFEDASVAGQLGGRRGARAMTGVVRFGAALGGKASYRGLIDEARVSNGLRAFYARDVGWTDPQARRPIPAGRPYFRDERDLVLHAPFDGKAEAEGGAAASLAGGGTPRFLPGMRGKGMLVGRTAAAPAYPAAGLVTRERGSFELWFSPHDWDNRREQANQDPMEFVPLLAIAPGAGGGKPLVTFAIYHKMPLNRLRPPVVHPGKWYHVVGTWDGGRRRLYLDGKPLPSALGFLAVEAAGDAAPGTVTLDPAAARLAYTGVHTLVDELRVYSRALAPEEAVNAHARYRPDRAPEPLPFAHVDVEMNYPLRRLKLTGELLGPRRDEVARVDYSLFAPGRAEPLAKAGAAPAERSSLALEIEDIEIGYGKYRSELVFKDRAGREVSRQTVETDRPRPPWLGTEIGIHEGEPLPGWAPVEVDGATVRLGGREIAFAPSGFPASMSSNGAEMLASPVAVRMSSAGRAIALAAPRDAVIVVKAAGDRAVTAGELAGGGFALRTRVTTEFDGMMKVEAELASDGAASLDGLAIEIPLRAERAKFIGFWTGLANFRAGCDYRLLPEKEGVLFESARPGRPRSRRLRGSFIPYLHLADDRRGLAWFAENDRGWTKSDRASAVEVAREGDVATLRLNILSERTEITRPRTFVFGLHLTPVRPLPREHRSKTVDLNFGWVDSFSKQDLKSDRGANSFMIYPVGHDWDAAAMRAKVHVREYGASRGYAGPILYMDRVWPGLPPEAGEFSPVWYASGRFRYLREAADCVVWHVKEWLRRGLVRGVYIDDAWVGVFGDLKTCLAYRMEDGTVQPGFEFFGYREAQKRLRWAFHELGKEPLIWVHMTQTYFVPCLSFADAVLDGEDRFLNWGAKRTFIGSWGLARLRHNNAEKWGIPAVWMNKIGNDKKAVVAMPHWEYRQNRAYHAGLALHDIRNVGGTLADLGDAGCYADDAAFSGYWDPSCPVRAVTKGAVASVYRRNGAAAIVVVNTASPEKSEPRVIELKVDAKGLGLGAASPEELRFENRDTYDPPPGEDVTKIKPPEGPSVSAGDLAGKGGGELADDDLLDGLMEEVESEAADAKAGGGFRYDDRNFLVEGESLKLRVRPHDYRLLLVRPGTR